MKKALSLFFALMVLLCANALPVKRQNAPQMAQANEIGYAEAMYRGHAGGNYTASDWWIALYTDASDNRTLIAMLEIHTATDSTIAGTYVIGTPFVSYYGDQNQYDVTGGTLTIQRKGVAEVIAGETKMQLPEYSIVASNLVVNGSLYSISGTCGVLSYDFDYMKAGKDASEWLIILKDKEGQTPQDSKTVTINLNSNLWVDDSYIQDGGFWGFGGSDGTYTVQILVDGTAVTGSYSKIDTEYSSIKKGNVVISIASGYGSAYDGGDGATYDMNFFVTATDGTIYNIILNTTGSGSNDDPFAYDDNAAFSATYSLDQMEIDLSNFNTKDDNGNPIHYIWLDATSKTDGVSLLFIAPNLDDETDLPEGTYTVASTGADNTLMASDGYIDEYFYQSYAAKFDAQGNMTNVWFIVSGQAVVTKENGKLKIVISARNTLNQRINVTIGGDNGGNNGGNNQNDPYALDATTPFNEYYSFASQDNGKWGSDGYITVTAQNTSSRVNLRFYSKKMTLEAGNYTINNTGVVNTLYASQGFVNNAYTPSYATNLAGTQYWYLVSGYATVSYDQFNQLSLTVNGYNANGVAVSIQVGQATALDEVEANTNGVTKTIDENGQVVIIRNGVRYNLQGAVIK